MSTEINWHRSNYESRVDVASDHIESFVGAVLNTIDVDSARSSSPHWKVVCHYFAGSARAARAQGATPRAGGKRIAAHLTTAFPSTSEGSNDGFFEFMDWLSHPDRFHPSALRAALELR